LCSVLGFPTISPAGSEDSSSGRLIIFIFLKSYIRSTQELTEDRDLVCPN
jgi:hypothetical protein